MARCSPIFQSSPNLLAKMTMSLCASATATVGGSRTLIDASAEFVLGFTHLSQQRYWIKRTVHLVKTTLDRLVDRRMRQSPLVGRCRHMVTFDHLGAPRRFS